MAFLLKCCGLKLSGHDYAVGRVPLVAFFDDFLSVGASADLKAAVPRTFLQKRSSVVYALNRLFPAGSQVAPMHGCCINPI